MTEEEWLASDDPIAMLKALRADWRGEDADLLRLTNRYLLACCRAIWTLLPLEASRQGVEVAERFIEDRATREEFADAEYLAEGAALFLDPFEWNPEKEYHELKVLLPHFEWQPEEEDHEAKEARIRYEAYRKARIGPLVKDVEAIPAGEMSRMVRATADDADISPRQLLSDAAYFVDTAMIYSRIDHRDEAVRKNRKFLSPGLLRELVGSSFQPKEPGYERVE